MQRSALGTV